MTIDQKVRALLRKTVAAGCTPGEQVAATELARKLVAKHRLKDSDFTWPAHPPKKAAKGTARAPAVSKPGKDATRAAKATAKPRRADQVLAMLKRKEGVSIADLTEAFNVLPHSARAMISVFSRRSV